MIVRRNNLANRWKSSLKQESGLKGPVETSFRHDFKIPDTASCYTQSIKPPEPARINISCNQPPKNVDETYRSVTKAAYRTQNTENSTTHKSLKPSGFDRQRIYNTNFKMSVDNSFLGYCTSHHAEFPCETATGRSPLRSYADTLSVLKVSKPGPLGNKTDDIQLPKPSYLDSYKAIPSNTYKRIIKKNPNEDHMEDTFHNPSRVGSYLTTSIDAFKGLPKTEDNPLSHTADLQKKRITSIAFGDSDRFQETESVCQETYRLPCTDPLSQQRKYDKHSAHAVTYQSSLNLGDPVRFNEMKSTLLPFYGKTERSLPVQYERNASSFPVGDLNDNRVKERLSNTIHSVYSKPPLGSFPDHSVNSHLRTLSHIHLGEKARIPSEKSTMKQSYRPLVITGIEHMRAPLKDNIPFDYPGDELCSTVKDDFVKKVQSENDKPNRMILENLKKSHWKLPNMDSIPNYCTTHQATFTLPAFSKTQ